MNLVLRIVSRLPGCICHNYNNLPPEKKTFPTPTPPTPEQTRTFPRYQGNRHQIILPGYDALCYNTLECKFSFKAFIPITALLSLS